MRAAASAGRIAVALGVASGVGPRVASGVVAIDQRIGAVGAVVGDRRPRRVPTSLRESEIGT